MAEPQRHTLERAPVSASHIKFPRNGPGEGHLPRLEALVGIECVKYSIIIRDDLTRFTWIYSLPSKSQAPANLEKFLSDVRDHDEVRDDP